jgi:O-antigen/teichoic acid export membrane protein
MLGSVSRQGAAVFLGRGAFLVLGLASNVLLSRILGPAGLGKFQLGFVLIQLVTTFCVLGLDKALMRYFPILETRGAGSRTLLNRSTGFVIAISLASSAALFVVAPALANHYFHSAEMTGVVRMFCLYLPVFALFRFLSGAVMALKRADFASTVTNILSPAAFLVLLALAGMVHAGLYTSILARSLSHLGGIVCLAVFLLRRIPKRPGDAAAAGSLKGYFRLSIPLFFVGLSYLLLGQMDIIMLGHFVSEKEVGVYSVAVRISAFVIVGLEIVLPIVAPLFSQLGETRDAHSTAALFRAVTKWVCNSALIIFALIAVFRVEILNVFGKGFASGATVLLILSAGQLVNAVSGPCGQLLAMTGKQKWEVVNTILIVALNFVLCLVLIPRMGTMGAAVATGLSISVINIVKLAEIYFAYGFHPYNARYIKGVVAVSAGCLVCYYVRALLFGAGWGSMGIIVLAGLAFMIAALAGFFMLGLDQEDRMAVAALRRR